MIDEAVIARALTIQGWMSELELRWLAEQASTHRAIAEIGCWKGRSTCVLAAHTQGRVWVIDHWLGQLCDPAAGPTIEVRAHGAEAIYQAFLANLAPWHDRVAVLRLSSAEAATAFAPASLDFVFIDGAHDYEGCAADIQAYRPLLTPGGLLAGHDYSEYGRSKGVVRAVDELVGPTEHVSDSWWRIV